jgi:hypothetical protein
MYLEIVATFLTFSKKSETCFFLNEYDQLHILIERRTFLTGQERTISAALDRMFLSGQHRLGNVSLLKIPRFEVELIDVGLALPPALY